MIKLKNILLEKDEKSDSENPDKILVKNKESGKSYYISKDSFDPSKHEKSESGETKTKKEPSGGGLMDRLKAAKEKVSSDKKEDEAPIEKKDTPKEKLEKKLGSFVFLDDKEIGEIADDSKDLRPDLKEKLLKFEFTSFFREYDTLTDTLGIQNKNKDTEGAKETVKTIRKMARRIQAIAVAKLAALGMQNDSDVINSAKMYHDDSTGINYFLRSGGEINWDKETLAKIINTPEKKLQQPTKWRMYNILVLDEHFKSEGARLPNDTVVYRGVHKDVLQKLVDAGEWVDNGFVSTSLNPLIAEDFTERSMLETEKRKQNTPVFKINLKRGDRVLALPCAEDGYCIEAEITLPRGCKFIVKKKDIENNIYEVDVEYPNA